MNIIFILYIVYFVIKTNIFVVLDIFSGNVTPPTKTDYGRI